MDTTDERDTTHPGRQLKEHYLDPLGITPYALAKGMGVHLSRITRLIAGERAITLDTATRLGLFFEVPTRWWLEMQMRYDQATSGLRESLADEVTAFEGLRSAAVGPRKGWRLGPPKPRSEPVVLRYSTARPRPVMPTGPPDRPPKVIRHGNGFVALIGSE